MTLGAIWTVIAVGVYRSYARALADEMRGLPLGAGLVDIAEEEVAVRALLRSDDARDVRLGLDLLAGVVSPASAIELREVARHADAEVRVRALAQLASSGDAGAAGELAACVDDLAHSAEPADRRAAAIALGARDTVAVDTRVVVELLDDVDPTVRAAALDAVGPGDAGEPEVVRRVVAAVEEPRTTGSATAALRRLGDAAIPFLRAAVNRDGAARRGPLVRAVAIAAREHGVDLIAPALADPDRAVVLEALDALEAAGTGDLVPPELLDVVLRDAAAHAARALEARESLDGQEGPLHRALEDEIDLARRLVIAVLALRHGDRVRAAVRVVDYTDGQRRALGLEALDVILSREEASIALPLMRGEQGDRLGRQAPARSAEDWIADMTGDPDRVWRSSWLAECARHAAVR